jgi:hypothetical protein
VSRRWIETSASEATLAHAVGQVFYGEFGTVDETCRAMEDLASDLAMKETRRDGASKSGLLVPDLRGTFPQLDDVNLAKPFPESETDLTANFFGRLSHELGVYCASPTDSGMVGTPHVLAKDMVALAALFWLERRTGEPREVLWPVLFGKREASSSVCDKVLRGLKEARWYDPCVGGGVFPVAIVLFLARLGLTPRAQLSRTIRGSDVNPFAVTATNIRLALLGSNLSGEPYTPTRLGLPPSFAVRNSLEYCHEQVSLDVGGLAGEDGHLADIVIGNPPYVRADRLKRDVKTALKGSYPSVAGGSVDLYNYFIAHGLVALNENGTLCYVSPASFQRSKYGAGTRRFVSRQGSVSALFDFDELPVFNAGVHTSVYVVEKGRSQGTVLSHAFNELPDKEPMLHGIEHAKELPPSSVGEDGWSASDVGISDILEAIAADTVPLASYAGPILSGIKTGHKRAYFVGSSAAHRLDDGSGHFLKRVLRPASIRAYRPEWDGTYLIVVRKGEVLPQGSPLMEHLSSYEAELRRRSDVQGHPTWYGLRECGYYGAFDRPKIVFPDIASECRFAMDTSGYYVPDGAFAIPSPDYSLLGVLNSCVGRFYFRARCNSIGNPHRGGRLRFKKAYVKGFPVPKPTGSTAQVWEEVGRLAQRLATGGERDGLLDRIDELAMELYRVPLELRDTLRGVSTHALS